MAAPTARLAPATVVVEAAQMPLDHFCDADQEQNQQTELQCQMLELRDEPADFDQRFGQRPSLLSFARGETRVARHLRDDNAKPLTSVATAS